MNSVSTDHEITCCDLFAYILKNQVMLVQICEEGVGGEKRKNLSCLQSINSATCCLTLQGALLFSPYLLFMVHIALSSKTELALSLCSGKFIIDINIAVRE